jgi:DNA-binding response OmpR family regulator
MTGAERRGERIIVCAESHLATEAVIDRLREHFTQVSLIVPPVNRIEISGADLVVHPTSSRRTLGESVATVRQLRQCSSAELLVISHQRSEAETAFFDAGATDVLDAGASPGLFDARVQAALRRRLRHPLPDTTPELAAGRLLIDLDSHLASLGGRRIDLTRLQFRVLTELVRSAETVVPVAQLRLLPSIGNRTASVRSIQSAIVIIRRRLRIDASIAIETVHGVGYQLSCSAIGLDNKVQGHV